jgi:hypothetical protein
MVAGQSEASRSIGLAYEITEEARQLLVRAGYARLAPPRRAASEAAYYLSDTLAPDDRVERADAAHEQAERERAEPALDAYALLEGVAVEVEKLLRGPEASSELRIALRAIRFALSELAGEIALEGADGGGLAGLQRRALSRG